MIGKENGETTRDVLGGRRGEGNKGPRKQLLCEVKVGL
jgi:hypothetical protein